MTTSLNEGSTMHVETISEAARHTHGDDLVCSTCGVIHTDTLTKALAGVGYVANRQISIALSTMMAGHKPGVLILEGQPGTGKSALPEALSKALGGRPFLEMLCHNWTTDEDTNMGVDVPAAVAGDAAHTARPGILYKAAEMSHEGPVIVLLDEIDKAPEKVESLLLTFLQNGRVQVQPGVMMQANLDNLLIFLTSNKKRELMEATLRRGFRLMLYPLPESVECDILRKRTGAPISLIRSCVRMANVVRTKGASCPSLQEIYALLLAVQLATCKLDCEVLLRGRLVKQPADWSALEKTFTHPENALFGAIVAARRERGIL